HDKEATEVESFDTIVQTPSHKENSNDEGNDDVSHDMNIGGDKGPDAEDDDKELYGDVNINLEGRDVQMTDVYTTQVLEDTHVTLTLSNRLRDKAQAENEEFLKNLDESIQKIIKEQVKEQVKLKVDTLTLELLTGPTYDLIKGSCKSLVKIEFFHKEVYKATTDQLDWNNPKGQQYPHNLLKTLPLIPNSRGRHVIPFDRFINNDLEYLSGVASIQKYTTSVTKTKAADYGHIKWIEDLVPHTMWSQAPVSYDKYALWGISYWGRKHQQFYGFLVNRESARDAYSKRRIIAVTEL
nr:hypothetical protein [Tanacetum cinerariifolium]